MVPSDYYVIFIDSYSAVLPDEVIIFAYEIVDLTLVKFFTYEKSASWTLFYEEYGGLSTYFWEFIKISTFGCQIIGLDYVFYELITEPIHAPDIIDDILPMISFINLLCFPVSFLLSIPYFPFENIKILFYLYNILLWKFYGTSISF